MATRYTDKKKAEVVKFVQNYDAKNGRGGQAAAKKKYKINPISIKKWCVEQGVKTGGKSAKKKVKKTTAAKPTRKKAGRKPAAKKKTTRKTTAKKKTTRKKATRSKTTARKSSGGANGSDSARMAKLEKKIASLETKLNRLKKAL